MTHPSEGGSPTIPARPPAELEAELARLRAERARLQRQLEERSRELVAHAHALADSEARFRDVIERNADAIVVVDREGDIQFANGAACRIFNSTREALVGTSFGFPLVAGETTELDLVSNGEPCVVEMRVVQSEWDGQPANIASLRDITERKRAEEIARGLAAEQAARRAAESLATRFRFLAECGAVLSSSLDYTTTLSEIARLCGSHLADWVIVYVVDADGSIQRLEIAHRDPDKAQTIEQLLSYPLQGAPLATIARVIESGQPLVKAGVGENELQQFAQDERHLELIRQVGLGAFMLVPMVARQKPIGAIALISAAPQPFSSDEVALARDLAARAALAVDNARLYEDAKRANQVKTDFLALISHDLRTPLNSIIGYAELMGMGIPDPITDGQRVRLERIRSSAGHLLYLMNELLAFARLDSKHEEIDIGEAELGALTRDVVSVVEPLASERGLTLKVDLPAEVVLLRTDANKVRQVLVNLVTNAIKYTEQGQVGLWARRTGETVTIEVRDTGGGIAPEHLERIFEPFWQIDTSQRTRGGGTGLGLSIVKRLVQLLAGEITVESALQRGSIFRVTLPITLTGAQSRD